MAVQGGGAGEGGQGEGGCRRKGENLISVLGGSGRHNLASTYFFPRSARDLLGKRATIGMIMKERKTGLGATGALNTFYHCGSITALLQRGELAFAEKRGATSKKGGDEEKAGLRK